VVVFARLTVRRAGSVWKRRRGWFVGLAARSKSARVTAAARRRRSVDVNDECQARDDERPDPADVENPLVPPTGWPFAFSRSTPPLSCHWMSALSGAVTTIPSSQRCDVELQPTDPVEAPARKSTNLIEGLTQTARFAPASAMPT